MSYEWPTEDWSNAVEVIKAKYPNIPAGSALAVLAEAGWTLTPPDDIDGCPRCGSVWDNDEIPEWHNPGCTLNDGSNAS